MYNQIELVVDSFTQVRVQNFLAKCTSNGLNIIDAMNDSISAYYSLDTTYDWMEILLRRVYYMDNKVFPMVYVENFFGFSIADFAVGNPEIAYTYFDQDYPFQSITSSNGLLTLDQSTNSISWNLIAIPGPWITRIPQILICSPDPSTTSVCSMCDLQPSIGALPWATGIMNPQSHEIGIFIGNNYQTASSNSTFEMCQTIYNANVAYNISISNYAVLRALPLLPFYQKTTNVATTYARIGKITSPIEERFNNTIGSSITLCMESNLFHDLNETGPNYGLGYGGIYKIYKPGTDFKPVYFYFPYSHNLWYLYGPDMNIFYSENVDFNNTCPNGDPRINENFFVGACEFCGQGQSVFGMSLVQEKSVLATTDFQAIYSYWSDNAISIGFNTGTTAFCVGNTYSLLADNNSSNDCVLSNYANLGPLVGQLSVIPFDGSYEIQNNFINDASFAPGTNFLIHVIAKYQNGESLNDCISVTLNPDPTSSSLPFKNISCEIRGNIND